MAKNYFGLTDPGRMRSNNEDTFIAEPVLGGRYIAASVIDGVGGYEGGEVAAQLARDTIIENISNVNGDIVTTLKASIIAANQRIFDQKKESRQNGQMACVVTLALVDIENNIFYYAHVGDTRLYLLRDKSLVKVTKDHSFVGFLEDSGRLTEEAAMNHPKRNEINKALGFDGEIAANADYIETGESPFLPSDKILLCSDGLTDMVSNKDITSILTNNKSLSDQATALINAANKAGGKDNITVVLVLNDKTPVKQEATKPIAPVKRNVDVRKEEENDKQSSVTNSSSNNTKRSGRGTVRLLAFLLLLVVAALAWVLYKDYKKTEAYEDQVQDKTTLKERNQQEQAFVDNIDNTTNGEVFLLTTTPGQNLIVSDSILIHKDTLRIIGNGMTLTADSTFKGPAFIVSPTTKYFLLDSLTLENFDVGVLMKSPGLHLRNVQFTSCKVPVQYQLMFPPNAVVNGRLSDTLFSITSNPQNNY